MSDWQPISTAPKSTSEPRAGGHQVRGVYFLAYCPDESVTDPQGCMCVCWWEPHMHGVGKGGWQGEGDYELRPTHWMPLPSRGPDSAEDDDSVQCDACGEMVPRDNIAKVTAYGIETSACAKCRGDG